jgi:heat shock protein HslJ
VRKIRYLWLIAVLAAALLLAACGAGGGQNLAGTSWRLVEANGQLAPAGVEATITFKEGEQVSGSAGCNSYGGTYSVDGNNITFSEIISTLMACQDENVMALESTFLDALNAGGTFDVQGNTLTIDAANGTTLNFTSG